MPGVARVLDHFGDADGRRHHRRIDALVQRDGSCSICGVVVPDERERRLLDVLDGAAFAQELRVDRNAEVRAVALA
jgi:hypothetical protein